MIPYRQQNAWDCGPRCQLSALSVIDGSITYERLMAAWRRFSGNRHDSPWHHEAALMRLGALHREVTIQEIVNGTAPADRTVVLIHDVSDTVNAILHQHWVLYGGRRGDGKCILHWGDGSVKLLSGGEMTAAFLAGAPSYAYVVGEGSVPTQNWFKRLYCWFTQLV
jgi:hypothetical protein